jgi:uncharacterized NAD-dependent epimerase/dehydratase family protein
VIVVCHEADRKTVPGTPAYSLVSLAEIIDLNLTFGRRTNPAIRCAGVSINTANMTPAESERYLAQVTAELGLPAADPIRSGARFDQLVDSCLK